MCARVLQPHHPPQNSSAPQIAAKKPGSEAWADLLSGAGYSSESGMALAELSAFILRKGLGRMGK
jgi:hypothetical protein